MEFFLQKGGGFRQLLAEFTSADPQRDLGGTSKENKKKNEPGFKKRPKKVQQKGSGKKIAEEVPKKKKQTRQSKKSINMQTLQQMYALRNAKF